MRVVWRWGCEGNVEVVMSLEVDMWVVWRWGCEGSVEVA